MYESGLTYTLTTVNGYTITFNPTPFSSTSGVFLHYDGIQTSSGFDTEVTGRPQANGSFMDAGWKRGLTIAINAYLMYGTASARQTGQDNVIKALNDMTGQTADSTGTYATLSWTSQDGLTAKTIYRLQLLEPYSIQYEAGTLKSFQCLLGTEYPYAQGASANNDTTALTATGGGFTVPLTIPTLTFTASGGGQVTVTNSGTTTAYPKMRVYGPITSPIVYNSTLGKYISFTGTIASGDYWEIDLFEKTVKLNGSTSMASSLDIANTQWFGLGVGNTTLQLSGSSYDSNTKLRVIMYSTWG